MRTGTPLFVVFVAVLALGALLWWRFKGSGRTMTTHTAPVATRNHHSLPLFHYERAGAAPAPPVAPTPPPAPGSALVSLLPAEDLRAQEATDLQAEADRAEAAQAESRQQTADGTTLAETAADVKPAAPQPVSSRHATGAVASLLDALDEAPAASPTPAPPIPATAPTPEPDEEPAAPALFYNPITAPAPTANDQANRAAEIALRKQRRASMAADTAAQRDALSGLFPGATGKPAPGKPS
ncbi:MAG: hypothetical protein ACRYG7_39560 [Janthinobacterium lividum]